MGLGTSSSTSSIAENCNVLISSAEAELNVNTSSISRSVMIGCDVAQHAAGWKNAVIIGADAGTNATTVNHGLGIDKPVIFIGWNAGYNADDISHAVYIGEDAGKNSSNANESVFVGLNAGEESSSQKSVGIGNYALAGMVGTECQKNIEITAGLGENRRLLHPSKITPNTSNKIAIQMVLAGDHQKRNLSIGDAILDPDAPLSVRRDNIMHASNDNNFIQTWYCNDVLVASLDCDGNFDAGTAGVVEGLLTSPMTAPSNSATEFATDGLGNLPTMDVYKNGAATGDSIEIHNRDKSLTAITGSFIVAQKIGSEYRPIWVGCS